MPWFASHLCTLTLALFLSVALYGCNGGNIQTDNADMAAVATATEGGNSNHPNDSPTLSFMVRQSGGCIRRGPNCAVHKLYNDGSVDVTRNAEVAVEGTGQVDIGLLNSWLDLVAVTNFAELRNRLSAGQCAGCVDGVDFEYTMHMTDTSEVLSSIEYRFDDTEPFFALTNGVYEAMQIAAPLPIRMR